MNAQLKFSDSDMNELSCLGDWCQTMFYVSDPAHNIPMALDQAWAVLDARVSARVIGQGVGCLRISPGDGTLAGSELVEAQILGMAEDGGFHGAEEPSLPKQASCLPAGSTDVLP